MDGMYENRVMDENKGDREETTEDVMCKRTVNMKIKGDVQPTFDFEEKSGTSDFALIVEGKKLFVSKAVLSIASPVFERMFNSEFKESTEDERELPGKKVEDVREFLQCIYPNVLKQITRTNARRLVPLVEEYQVINLKARCEKVLEESVDETTPVDELLERLNDAELYHLEQLSEKCVTLASQKSLQELRASNEHCKLSKEIFANIIERRVAILEDNNELLTKQRQQLEEKNNIWKYFFSADDKSSGKLNFDGNVAWKEDQFVLIAHADEFFSSKQIDLWGIPLRVFTEVKELGSINRRSEWLVIKVEKLASTKIDIRCKISIRLTLVSQQPNGINITSYFQGKITPSSPQMSENVKNVEKIESENAGLLRDSKLAMIVSIRVSEPSRLYNRI